MGGPAGAEDSDQLSRVADPDVARSLNCLQASADTLAWLAMMEAGSSPRYASVNTPLVWSSDTVKLLPLVSVMAVP